MMVMMMISNSQAYTYITILYNRFDIPDNDKTGCLRRDFVYEMLYKDTEYPMFDWTQFRLLQHVCLRLSPLGLKQKENVRIS
jgi:hypothetical protein